MIFGFWLRSLWFLVLLFASFGALGQSNAPIVLKSGNYVATIEPRSLETKLRANGGQEVVASAAQKGLGAAANLKVDAATASWELPDLKLHVDAKLDAGGLAVHFLSEKTGEVTFPIIREDEAMKGWILPMFEGVYVPRGDAKWAAFLKKQEDMSTTAELTMPFVGLDCGDFTMTCIITNAFNNALRFEESPTKDLQARLTHQFTRNHPVKECGFLFVVGTNSPVEPANIYRHWLIKRGDFVTMSDKIKRTPEGAKLAGAAQIYLWGSDLIAPENILNWKQFVKELKAQGEAEAASPGKRVWSLMQPGPRKFVETIGKQEWPDKYSERQVTEDLSRILISRDFYDKSIWPEALKDPLAAAALKRDRSEWTLAETCRVNSKLLAAAFPGLLAKPDDWGDGICPKMVRELADAGFDRLWLGSGSWDEFEQRPEIVDAAKKAGFLIGPYDSYNSVHRPGASETWETSQFDEKLYETGGIVNANGKKRAGFKKVGYILNPIAARPYMEERVGRLMKEFHANSWFMDCDAFGDYCDDYSEAHPMTQRMDMQARIARMAWIQDTFGAVVGSEGCSAGVASTIFFAHGVMTPVIGWGDPDLTDKKSKYYLGKYYPPPQPEVFFKPVPAKEEYRYIYFEPRFRLPLFETAFHDSVVATHHWSEGSWKTEGQTGTVELLELLYNVPPLYHLNLAEFQKRKAQMKRHYDFFSPLHRLTATMPMTDFKWLTTDRAVQQTEFGHDIEMTVNFGATDYHQGEITIPKRSIVARTLATGETKIYSVTEKPE